MKFIYLTGHIYGHLCVIERGANTTRGQVRWWCKCLNCANDLRVLVVAAKLRNGHTRSCGCLHIEAQLAGARRRRALRNAMVGETFHNNTVPCPPSTCILWTGGGGRYGSFTYGGVVQGAHRVAWQLAHGAIPKGLQVCHSCDVPGCVNHEHLFLGTQLDNKRDAARKERNAKGEVIANSVMTEEIVRIIRNRFNSGEKPLRIAQSLGLKRAAVSHVAHYRNWRHLA